ncbi:MAG: hypothetical protein MK110_08640 [Fuerstiella sp.]|nr:hypothetical protein [Fuerstiella sp.]
MSSRELAGTAATETTQRCCQQRFVQNDRYGRFWRVTTPLVAHTVAEAPKEIRLAAVAIFRRMQE